MDRPRDRRLFGVVNATGSTKPDAISRPFIRSFVMWEANRLIPSQGPSSQTAPQISTYKAPENNAQTQKFRYSSTGLQVVPCSTRQSADQPGSERDFQLSSITDSAAASSDAATDNIIHGLLGMEVDGAPTIEETNMSFGYQSASPAVISTVNNVLMSEMRSPTEPASSFIGAMFLASQDLQSTIGEELLDPVQMLPLTQSQRTQLLMHHCKSS